MITKDYSRIENKDAKFFNAKLVLNNDGNWKAFNEDVPIESIKVIIKLTTDIYVVCEEEFISEERPEETVQYVYSGVTTNII